MIATIPQLWHDHINFTLVLNVLERQIDRVDAGQEASQHLVTMSLTYLNDFAFKIHRPKEELICGALLRQRHILPSTAFGILQDHRDFGADVKTLKEMVAALNGRDADGAEEFCTLAHRFIAREYAHMMIEEQRLYPDAIRRLSRREWSEIDRRFADADDPDFGDAIARPLTELRLKILALDQEMHTVQ